MRRMLMRLAGFCSILLLLSGCSEQGQAPSLQSVDERPGVLKSFVRQHYDLKDPTELRASVPDHAIAYIRVPSLFGFVSAPKGDLFTDALADRHHQQQLIELQRQLLPAVQETLQQSLKPFQKLVFEKTRSPIEALILAVDQQPLPQILVSVEVDFADQKAFAAFVQQWADQQAGLYLLGDKVDAKGYASLAGGPMSIQLHYDASEGRLRAMAGMGATREQFDQAVAALKPNDDHPMHQLEGQVDTSRQGLFIWINNERLFPAIANTLPAEKYQQLERMPISQARQFGFGWGVSDGKGRLKLVADFKPDVLTRALPAGNMQLDFTTSGVPRMLFAMSLATPQELQRLRNFYRDKLNPEEINQVSEFRQEWKNNIGLDIEEILQALGPEMFMFQDQLGEYSVIAVRDRQRYRQLLKKWVAYKQVRHEQLTVNGVDMHYVQLEPFWIEEIRKKQKQEITPLGTLLARIRSHVYWMEEGDHLVFAALPQLLVDRARFTHQVSIREWLQKIQRQDASHALLLMSGSIQGSPRRLYYTYLQALHILADIAGVRLKLHELPSARSLSFPEYGAYGLQVSVTQQQLSAELVFEANPLEFIFGQNMMTNVAVVGVLAAIAIPAYHDYTVRAQVNEALVQSHTLKQWVEEYWQQHQAMPNKEAISGFDFDRIRTQRIARIELIPDTGTIVLTLNGHAQIQGQRLSLVPTNEQGVRGLQWHCRSEFAAKYLPRACR